MRLLDAVVQVSHHHARVLGKVHHEVLPLLQLLEPGDVELVDVVEEQVGFARELHAQARERALVTQRQYLHPDRLERANLPGLLVALRRAKLERHLALVEDAVAVR